jgi:hypothetical protein
VREGAEVDGATACDDLSRPTVEGPSPRLAEWEPEMRVASPHFPHFPTFPFPTFPHFHLLKTIRASANKGLSIGANVKDDDRRWSYEPPPWF